MKLTESELAFWNKYLDSQPAIEPHFDYTVEANPAGVLSITDKLIALYLNGTKTAGSGLVEDYEVAGDALPKVGNFWIVLDSNSEPRIILKTVRTEINKFPEVPEYIAIAEGEGDLSLEYWKTVHAKFYEPHLSSWNLLNINDSHVITEFFELVWK
ncbi:ASCH domain-containing protein [Enterovibrio calviensis]|uniref:ASCH domain-containing protein n=1 Tax=Enterovibrio calviensis TaxID=91359 RepID=UPI000688C7CC|nr:ASCH domain-containing protein [Enterovibrio calviensis]